jgi:hypothetical protein
MDILESPKGISGTFRGHTVAFPKVVKTSPRNPRSVFQLEAIEPRVLLSADLIPQSVVLSSQLEQTSSSPAPIVQSLENASPIVLNFENTPDNSAQNSTEVTNRQPIIDALFDVSSVKPLLEEAVKEINRLPLNSEQQKLAANVDVKIADLPGWALGQADSNGITIDSTAAGNGWFVDSTPADNSEFTKSGGDYVALSGSTAENRVDLLTVLIHELGHYVGFDHTDSGFMQAGVRPGVRRTIEDSGNTITDQLTESLRDANGPPNQSLTLNPTISWNTDSSGFWDVASNWLDSTGVVRAPNSTDDVLLDRGAANPTITIRSSASAHAVLSNESLVINSVFAVGSDSELDAATTLSGGTINGPGSVTNVGTLTLSSSTINAPLINQGVLVERATSSINGSFLNDTSAVLRVQGDASFSNANLTIATGFANKSLIELTAGAPRF